MGEINIMLIFKSKNENDSPTVDKEQSWDWRASQVVLVLENLPAKAGDMREMGSIPGLGRSLEKGNPLQYSCLGNPMDRGAWRATVHRGSQLVRHE